MTVLDTAQGALDWALADPTHLMAIAAALAALTPTPDPNTLAGKAYKVLDILALNFMKAKDTGVPPAHGDAI